MRIEPGWPITSSALYPKRLSAPPFQLVMMPFKSLLMIASSEFSIIAARKLADWESASFPCHVDSGPSRSAGFPVDSLSDFLNGNLFIHMPAREKRPSFSQYCQLGQNPAR